MNWGKGLTLAILAFALMMAWFVFKASQNPMPLVTEDYYGAELKYQGRIDETARAHALSAPVRIALQRSSVGLIFPQEMQGSHITGTLNLLRPDNPAADRIMQISTDSLHLTIPNMDLVGGRYNTALEWQVAGVKYFTEEKVYVP